MEKARELDDPIVWSPSRPAHKVADEVGHRGDGEGLKLDRMRQVEEVLSENGVDEWPVRQIVAKREDADGMPRCRVAGAIGAELEARVEELEVAFGRPLTLPGQPGRATDDAHRPG